MAYETEEMQHDELLFQIQRVSNMIAKKIDLIKYYDESAELIDMEEIKEELDSLIKRYSV